jgi:hypothetical protein
VPRHPTLSLCPDAAPFNATARPSRKKSNPNRNCVCCARTTGERAPPRPRHHAHAPPAPNCDVCSPPPSAHSALEAASPITPIAHPSFVWMHSRLWERRCSRRWEEKRCNTRSTFETSKYNGCNIHMKTVETLEKHT